MAHANFERVDLDRVYLPFSAVSLEVIARCAARGIRYVATHGFRDLTEQAELRRLYLAGKCGKASPAGLSAQNYGLAFDFVCDASPRPGAQSDWREPAYRVLGEESAKAGLVWGGRFGDSPHV
ncbi:M15 family metallopeptidase [Myxococcus hansupus]|uniref:M15 family metallopeptidase n=1 Tax=Pseudomyxococcus hansupus TaxID=1297742 RepID=UPI000272FC0E|nr:M15 family metallopeptidase [Myxococcus hansupus]